eukprot:CAMPEP_0114996624 /NCGR_PEP_ID=MMETSP0216-20121206/14429_1 /TAXON_ID=223996 /ORGANISM="Protocruzia adherens, Strain Boccale" /LENGTH=483 /DNA_ID=CAMNT_0002360879 /DNA_START=135 /DNA_END=1586 /DNA_ORIENTATION=+
MSRLLAQQQEEEDSRGRITEKFIKKLLRSDHRTYYSTPELNDKLYLHYKGFRKIENLEVFTGLKVLYLEGNGIEKMSGLDKLTELRCLYLHENIIQEIEGIETLTKLDSLNLTDNCISTISGLEKLTNLHCLQIKRNKIGANGVSDYNHLVKCAGVTTLDISDNKIDDVEILNEVLKKMPKLRVLYLSGNPVCKKIQNYRKKLIAELPQLNYLDDRPVFDDERRFAEAFSKGGLEAERKERKLHKEEQEAQREANLKAFRDLLEEGKKRRAEAKERGESGEADSEHRNCYNDSEMRQVSEDHMDRSAAAADVGHGVARNEDDVAYHAEDLHSQDTNLSTAVMTNDQVEDLTSEGTSNVTHSVADESAGENDEESNSEGKSPKSSENPEKTDDKEFYPWSEECKMPQASTEVVEKMKDKLVETKETEESKPQEEETTKNAKDDIEKLENLLVNENDQKKTTKDDDESQDQKDELEGYHGMEELD